MLTFICVTSVKTIAFLAEGSVFLQKKLEMKYLILFGLIYMVYRYNTWKSQLGSANQKENSKIKDNEPDEGEFIDYEEVE